MDLEYVSGRQLSAVCVMQLKDFHRGKQAVKLVLKIINYLQQISYEKNVLTQCIYKIYGRENFPLYTFSINPYKA